MKPLPDAYDVARQITSIWELNVNKYSGHIVNHTMKLPLYVECGDSYYRIVDASFHPDKGIVLTFDPTQQPS
jgi:hypothetical protein